MPSLFLGSIHPRCRDLHSCHRTQQTYGRRPARLPLGLPRVQATQFLVPLLQFRTHHQLKQGQHTQGDYQQTRQSFDLLLLTHMQRLNPQRTIFQHMKVSFQAPTLIVGPHTLPQPKTLLRDIGHLGTPTQTRTRRLQRFRVPAHFVDLISYMCHHTLGTVRAATPAAFVTPLLPFFPLPRNEQQALDVLFLQDALNGRLQRLRFLKLSPSASDRRSQRPNLFLGTLQPLLQVLLLTLSQRQRTHHLNTFLPANGSGALVVLAGAQEFIPDSHECPLFRLFVLMVRRLERARAVQSFVHPVGEVLLCFARMRQWGEVVIV